MKKHKIKIKITDNIDEKRKKRRKKRRKQTKKRRNYGASWPYIGGYIGTSDDSFGDSGDGGGGE